MDRCRICLSEIFPDYFTPIKCRHSFHKCCIRSTVVASIENQLTCPICRSSLVKNKLTTLLGCDANGNLKKDSTILSDKQNVTKFFCKRPNRSKKRCNVFKNQIIELLNILISTLNYIFA